MYYNTAEGSKCTECNGTLPLGKDESTGADRSEFWRLKTDDKKNLINLINLYNPSNYLFLMLDDDLVFDMGPYLVILS